MQIRRLAPWLVGLLIIALIAGCSEDKGTNGGPEAPKFQVKTINVPQKMAQSQDPMAKMAVAYIGMANAIGSHTSLLSPPASAMKLAKPVSIQGWTYTWTEDALSMTLEVSESGNNYVWEMFLNGTDGQFTYNNWKSMRAEEAKDGNSGLLIAYKPVTTEISMKWTWETDPQTEVYTFVLTTFGEGGGKIEITSNPDDSGELAFYQDINGNYILTFGVEWLADGSGQWWAYDSGDVSQTGSWS